MQDEFGNEIDPNQAQLDAFRALEEQQVDLSPEEGEITAMPSGLEEAIAKRDAQRQKANMLGAFQQLIGASAAGTGYKTDTRFADQMRKDAESHMTDYKAKGAEAAAKVKAGRDEDKHKQGMEKHEQSMELGTQNIESAKLKLEKMGFEVKDLKDIAAMEGDLIGPVRTAFNASLKKAAEEGGYEFVPVDESLNLLQLNALSDAFKTGGMTEYQKLSLQLRERNTQNKEKGLVLRTEKEGRLGDQFDYRKSEKFEDDMEKGLQSMRKTETWKTAKKTLDEVDGITVLLDDAYTNGGQSLAMLGPKVAKAIAHEVGVLTETDVTRYVQNPSLLGGMMDTMRKAQSGKITEASYENLKRLLSISKEVAKDKINKVITTEATLISRREKIPLEEARFHIDEAYKKSLSNTFSEAQERGIQKVMKNNNVSREKAINALKSAGKLK